MGGELAVSAGRGSCCTYNVNACLAFMVLSRTVLLLLTLHSRAAADLTAMSTCNEYIFSSYCQGPIRGLFLDVKQNGIGKSAYKSVLVLCVSQLLTLLC